jgi:hypothetical protein
VRREASSHLWSPLRKKTTPLPEEGVKGNLAALAAWTAAEKGAREKAEGYKVRNLLTVVKK